MSALSPERRAELQADIAREQEYATRIVMTQDRRIRLTQDEVDYFLAATEPVADGEVARVVKGLREVEDYERGRCNLIAAERYFDVASLLERLARELAEARAAVAVHRPPPTTSVQGSAGNLKYVQGSAGNLKYEDGWT